MTSAVNNISQFLLKEERANQCLISSNYVAHTVVVKQWVSTIDSAVITAVVYKPLAIALYV